MAKRSDQNQESDIDTNAWLATYGDMITLLMCFFVIFFSISEVNIALFEDLKNGFESDITNKETKSPISLLAKQLDSIYDNPVDDNLDVEVDLINRGINIKLASNDLFRSGVPKDQSRAIGFADIKPIIEPRDSTGSLVKGARAINRRVEIVIHY
jgi:flagellar motor protein MotB